MPSMVKPSPDAPLRIRRMAHLIRRFDFGNRKVCDAVDALVYLIIGLVLRIMGFWLYVTVAAIVPIPEMGLFCMVASWEATIRCGHSCTDKLQI
jgi:hypothetical protein